MNEVVITVLAPIAMYLSLALIAVGIAFAVERLKKPKESSKK